MPAAGETSLETTPETSERMARVRRRDTSPEVALRSELHRRGLRFRVDRRPVAAIRSRADLVFGPSRVAVYVNGCFWHSCPEHGTMPKANREFWRRKLARNVERDREVDRRLEEAGWFVLRVWEHESPGAAADQVERAIRTRLAEAAGRQVEAA